MKSQKKALVDWFLKNRSVFPWRVQDPYALRDAYWVWISEIMLQQTQVSTVIPYFERWMERFKDVNTLAEATEEEVLSYWQGLGYYSRAKNILKSARIIKKQYLGILPSTRKELEALPGIGKYTAGAILSFAYHAPEAILDGNLTRIFSRLYSISFLPQNKKQADIYWAHATEWAQSPKAFLVNEALMDLGRLVCKVKTPNCSVCPLKNSCKAYLNQQTQSFPPTKIRRYTAWEGLVLVIESQDGFVFFENSESSPFFKNQYCLPHFKFSKTQSKNFPIQAESWVSFEQVISFTFVGAFKHAITTYKIEAQVMHLLLHTNASQNDPRWFSKKNLFEKISNAFSLKALEKVFNSH
jgi:A/G-specific adenine glycosylase